MTLSGSELDGRHVRLDLSSSKRGAGGARGGNRGRRGGGRGGDRGPGNTGTEKGERTGGRGTRGEKGGAEPTSNKNKEMIESHFI